MSSTDDATDTQQTLQRKLMLWKQRKKASGKVKKQGSSSSFTSPTRNRQGVRNTPVNPVITNHKHPAKKVVPTRTRRKSDQPKISAKGVLRRDRNSGESGTAALVAGLHPRRTRSLPSRTLSKSNSPAARRGARHHVRKSSASLSPTKTTRSPKPSAIHHSPARRRSTSGSPQKKAHGSPAKRNSPQTAARKTTAASTSSAASVSAPGTSSAASQNTPSTQNVSDALRLTLERVAAGQAQVSMHTACNGHRPVNERGSECF